MISNMTFDQAVAIHEQYLAQITEGEIEAREAILDFLGWDGPDEDLFAQDVRIVLASAEFSKEITSSVMWLIEHGIDISCVRMKPYSLDGRVVVDIQQIIPLPEAADYQVQVREKSQREREARVSNADFTRFDVTVAGQEQSRQAKRTALYFVCSKLVASGVSPSDIARLFSWRNNAFYWVDGRVGPEEFERLALAKSASGTGLTFDPPRWFADDGELFQTADKTFALSKMWGGAKWHRAMELLQTTYPSHAIVFEPSNTEES